MNIKKAAWAGVDTGMRIRVHVHLQGPQFLAHYVENCYSIAGVARLFYCGPNLKFEFSLRTALFEYTDFIITISVKQNFF